MTATYYDATQVFSRNYGSERLYKRSYCNSLLYRPRNKYSQIEYKKDSLNLTQWFTSVSLT